MHLLTLCGSTRLDSSNQQLLNYIEEIVPYRLQHYKGIKDLPLFCADLDQAPIPAKVRAFRAAVSQADGLLITTPEYIHNIPAALKNALEWLTSSGELAHKKTLAIVYAPHANRGEKALASLLWSLKALDAQVLSSLLLYHTDIRFEATGNGVGEEGVLLLKEALGLFDM